MNRFAAIILAAGYSSRMKGFKPLLTIGGETLIDRSIALFSQNDIDVVLVTGWQADKLLGGIKNQPFRIVENPDFATGMFSSIQAGVKSLNSNYSGFFILPVDIPLVRPFTIRRLREAFQPDEIIYPVCCQQRGHPPLIPAGLIPEILTWKGQGGLKTLLQQYESNSRKVEVPDENILLDIDTSEAYELALKRFKNYAVPPPNEQTAIWEIYKVGPDRRRHCEKVAETAVSLGEALIKAGQKIDLNLVQAASALHDIVRERPRHDEAGGQLLKEMGFEAVGNLVGVHTFLETEPPGYELESRVVYLADKFVQGDQVVTLEQRFQVSLQKYAVTPEVEARINQRKQRANTVKKDLEELLHYPLEKVILKAKKSQSSS